jgi:tripartite-type tricarboxylate transporter receptor subunit TctC
MFTSLCARASALALLGLACTAAAQTWPSKTVRIIVPFAPGGSTDIVARAIAARASESTGQSFVVDNRAGAGGNIGAEAASKAPADGHTLFMGHVGTLAINPALYRKIPYDAVRDFAPITLAIAAPLVLVTHPSLPAKNVKELIALARARPNQLSFSSAGNGSASHLAGELFNGLAGTKILHVPYKGTGPATTAILTGEVSAMFSGQGTSWPLIKAGRLKALAMTGGKRAANAPNVPAVSEALPGYEVINWHGVLAPAGTPPDVIKRAHAEVVKALASPDVRSKLSSDGFEVIGNSPEAFAQFIRAEMAKWAKIIKGSGIALE